MGLETKPMDNSPQTLPKELSRLVDALIRDRRALREEGRSEPLQEDDRASTIQTLKRILALGYRIEPPLEEVSQGKGSSICIATSRVLEKLKSSEDLKLADFLHIWKALLSGPELGLCEIYESLGNRILKIGQPIFAYDVLARGLQSWPESVRLRQLKALSLARTGATARANLMLCELHKKGHTDGETLGILARSHKDLSEQAVDASERMAQLRLAHTTYLDAYRLACASESFDAAVYTGINAATTALLVGNRADAQGIARRVRELCLIRLRAANDYWAPATLGEAAIILGEWNQAEKWYTKAAAIGRGNFGDQSSTRRQARLLMDFLKLDRHRFDGCFAIPRVLLFVGSMIDRSELLSPLSEPLEDAFRRQIAGRLKKFGEKIGYCGVECAFDILFIEEMVRQGNEINIVLPFPADDLEKAGTGILSDAYWRKRFRSVLEGAAGVVATGKHPVWGSRVVDEYSGLMQNGLALLRARMLDTDVVPMIVVDARKGDGSSGASHAVAKWRAQGLEPEVVDLAGLFEEIDCVQASSPGDTAACPVEPRLITPPPEFPQQIAALLIADVEGYGRLTEERFPRFVKHFLGSVADLVGKLPRALLVKNTWGDALYFVFSRVDDAGKFALDLRDRLCDVVWEGKESPGELNLRIALHAGPVFTWTDPVTGQSAATGWHVVRAARLEPKTPSGQVYASQAFAALAAAEGVKEFSCDYVGEIPLAKEFGTYPTYHVHRC